MELVLGHLAHQAVHLVAIVAVEGRPKAVRQIIEGVEPQPCPPLLLRHGPIVPDDEGISGCTGP